ncbi:hypothetical protein R3P38DRAFT_3298610 [Favolaschia claudopus]|uniref:DUF6534 domain-containing protein n=1 Tax=Favolaschia claudopus TaxID=2862362 RepID=A0AAV9Z2M3_9AGAR
MCSLNNDMSLRRRSSWTLPTPIVARGSLIPLDNLLGVWLIGLILSSVLFGITCLQVYLYFTKSCSRDRAILKAFVIGLFALDAFHLALVSHSLYSVAVTNFGDYVQLGIIPWSLLLQAIFGSLLSTMVRFFYAWRVYVISNKSLLLPSVIGCCSIFAFIFSAIYTQKGFAIKFFTLAEHLLIWAALALGIGAAADLLIAGTMIYYLSKNKTGFQKSTNKAINMLVAYSLSTGALTCVFAIGDVIAQTVAPASLVYALFFFILVRLHFLSFMSILNSRSHVREQLYAADCAMVTIPSHPTAPGNIADPDAKIHESRSIGLTDSRTLVSSTSKETVV